MLLIHIGQFSVQYVPNQDNGQLLEKILRIPEIYKANLVKKSQNFNTIGLPIPTDNEIIGSFRVSHLTEIKILRQILHDIDTNITKVSITTDRAPIITRHTLIVAVSTALIIFFGITLHVLTEVLIKHGNENTEAIFNYAAGGLLLAFIASIIGFFIELSVITREHNS